MSLFYINLLHFLSWSVGLLVDRHGLCVGVYVAEKPLSMSVHDNNNKNNNNTNNNTAGTYTVIQTPLPWPWPRDTAGSESIQPTSGPHLNGITSPSVPGPCETAHRNASARPSLQGSSNSTSTGVPISGPEKNSTKTSTHMGLPAPGMNGSSATDPLGCFRDSYVLPRPLPELIADFRGAIDVSDSKSTISACATKARERGFKVFGIQFYTECWSGSGAENTYGRDGSSTDCQNGVGKSGANFVYKMRDFGNPSCPMCTNPRRLCFPGVSRVTLKSGVNIRMRQLQIGDRVKTLGTNGKPMFSEVIGFLHREIDTVAQFYSLEVEGGRVLRCSPQHLVFRKEKFTSYTAVFASDIRLGDFLLMSDQNVSDDRAVVRISMVTETGVYAPLTEQGTLLVDGALVSCYAHWSSHHVAHLAMAPLRVLHRIQQTFQRFTGELGFTFSNSTEPNDGLSRYASTLVAITNLFITR